MSEEGWMIFLTGAMGFVGTGLLERFLADGQCVTAMMHTNSRSIPAGLNTVRMNVEDLDEQAIGFLEGHDVLIHAAARAHVLSETSLQPLEDYRRINRDATFALARFAIKAGVKRFIYISSVNVLGDISVEPFDESCLAAPRQDFAVSKYEAEQGLFDIAEGSGMEIVIIRPPLVYGPGVKGNFALMLNWVKAGVPLPFSTVHNKRSLVALENLVDFIALCSDIKRSPKAANEVFLVSDGLDVSTSELLRKVAMIYGVKSHLFPMSVGLMKFAATVLRKGTVADRLFRNLQVDISKARDLLGWKPMVTMDEQLLKMAAIDKVK